MTVPRGLFITGTDTGVGKTRVAALIARHLRGQGRRVGVLKPVATGSEPGPDGTPIWPDAESLAEALGGGIPRERIAPLVFHEPLAPPVAARRAGAPLDHSRVVDASRDAIRWWRDERGAEVLVVEGVGGWLCPLAEESTVADLALELDFPLVLVARLGLGTLNHTLLTLESATRRGARIAGVVLNGSAPTVDPLAESTNPEELVRRLGVDIPLLAVMQHVNESASGPLWEYGNDVDWWSRAAIPRAADRA